GRGSGRVRHGAASPGLAALGDARGHPDAAHVGTGAPLLGARDGAVHGQPAALDRGRAARERGRQAGGLLMTRFGVLLAGGQGKRLGAKLPKPLVVCAGRTLLDRALGTLAEICHRTLVVAPADMTLPVEASLRVDDPADAAGPLAGLVTALASQSFDD